GSSQSIRLPATLFDEKNLSYDTNDPIGVGASKTVYRGLWLGLKVAVGVLNAIVTLKDVNGFNDEIELMSRLKHPNIVHVFGSYHLHSSKRVLMVMECMKCSLHHSLYEESDSNAGGASAQNWSLPQRLRAMLDIARGV